MIGWETWKTELELVLVMVGLLAAVVSQVKLFFDGSLLWQPVQAWDSRQHAHAKRMMMDSQPSISTPPHPIVPSSSLFFIATPLITQWRYFPSLSGIIKPGVFGAKLGVCGLFVLELFLHCGSAFRVDGQRLVLKVVANGVLRNGTDSLEIKHLGSLLSKVLVNVYNLGQFWP